MRVIYDIRAQLVGELIDDLVIQLDDTKHALRREVIARCWDGAYDATDDLDGSTCWQACEKFVKFRLGKIPRKIKRTGRAWAISEENVKRGVGVVRLESSEPIVTSNILDPWHGLHMSESADGVHVKNAEGDELRVIWTAECGWQVIEEPGNGA